MELFIPGIKAPDKAYNNIRDSQRSMAVSGKKVCERLWDIFEPHADHNFVEQFQKDFYARFWEMDLTCALIEKGYDISCPKPGPDICINQQGARIWIEAIAPNSGTGPDQVPEIELDIVQSTPDAQIILRLTSAIAEKHVKYIKYLADGVVAENEPYIIAINGSNINLSLGDSTPPRIVKSVFPIGNQYVTLNKETLEIVGDGFEFKQAVSKQNGTDIPIDVFLNPKFEGISAVLYSNTDCANRPENTGNDYITVHNPLARNPMNEGYLKFGREFIACKYEDSECRLRWNDHKTS